jgi:hypothetical protein
MLLQMTSMLDLQIVNHCFAYMTFIHFISYKLSQLFCCDVVRRVKDLLGLSLLGLISRLLMGQVSLACKSSKPLYIKRGDVSI